MKKIAKKMNVAVLMGGLSAEREVSLKTGTAIAGALKRRGYPVTPLDVTREVARDLRRRRVDAAFVALHGRGGEDGTMQGLLETMGIPYTGSGVLASAVAMDKKHSKWVFTRKRLPHAPFTLLSADDLGRKDWPCGALAPPLVVKPTCEGSTIGISIVRKKAELKKALKSALRYGEEVLAETYIAGRELTVGVLGERPLAVVEIVAEGGFYDYRAKYRSGRTKYVVPAEVEKKTARRLQRLALSAHAALGCRGASRVDFRLRRDGRPFILEVNTIPGMTETSLLPKAAAAEGMDFDELVEWMLLDGLNRW
jgi:D-alanine-D-alanine ligase